MAQLPMAMAMVEVMAKSSQHSHEYVNFELRSLYVLREQIRKGTYTWGISEVSAFESTAIHSLIRVQTKQPVADLVLIVKLTFMIWLENAFHSVRLIYLSSLI